AVSQALDTDASNPSSRLMLSILSGVAEFEREIIRERTLAGVRAAKAAGKTLGCPRRVFRRDEVIRMRAEARAGARSLPRSPYLFPLCAGAPTTFPASLFGNSSVERVSRIYSNLDGRAVTARICPERRRGRIAAPYSSVGFDLDV